MMQCTFGECPDAPADLLPLLSWGEPDAGMELTMKFSFSTEQQQPELQDALAALAEAGTLPSHPSGSGTQVRFERVEDVGRGVWFARSGEQGITMRYTDVAAAIRGLGSLLAAGEGDLPRDESSMFRTLGIMLDCSRNAVMRVEHFRKWLRQLALLGFNMAMLYTEETYELPGEPWFGYMRGAYAADELRAIDQYAARLGIEMIPCIQTLGHLEQMLRWPAYRRVRDTDDVMLVGEPATYDLIEKMLDRWSHVFGSRRIHIGMDEAISLGRGRYLDRFGAAPAFDIFNEHLNRVMALCRDRGYRPMIWSDMYFRLGCKSGDYYDPATIIPDHVQQAIPADVQLVYWDYYHRDEAFYADWIGRHRDLGFEPVMATGAWTWHQPWHATMRTELQAGPAVRASRAADLRELFVTLWGDDGAMCDFDSAFAGLAFIAELAWCDEADDEAIARRFQVACGGDYHAAHLAGKVSSIERPADEGSRAVDTWGWMWDDPLLAPMWRHFHAADPGFWDAAEVHFARIRDGLAGKVDGGDDRGGGEIAQAQRIADWLGRKIALRRAVERWYARRDTEELDGLMSEIDAVIALCIAYGDALRRQWLERCKPFGFEVAQIRVAGHIERWQELKRRLRALAAGTIDIIEELEVEAPGPPWPATNAFRHVAQSSAGKL